MTAGALSFGFLGAIWQTNPPRRDSRVTEPATARAEFKGRGFTGSLCWAGGLVKGLQSEIVFLVPYSSWDGAGMPLPIRLPCSLLDCTAALGFLYKPASFLYKAASSSVYFGSRFAQPQTSACLDHAQS